jgi:hypothetical protein
MSDCIICLDYIDELDSILGCCSQVYHYRCFKSWLKYRQICTICKAPINPLLLRYLMITPNLGITDTRIIRPPILRQSIRPMISGMSVVTGGFTLEQITGCRVRGCSGFCLCHI